MPRIIATQYDRIAKQYHENRDSFDINHIIEQFFKHLHTPNGRLLDVGCGTGKPVAHWFLSKNWEVTGIDCSPEMIQLAKDGTPNMQVIEGDMCQVTFKKSTFGYYLCL